LKICVLVKEVPDAAVEKRINPSTGRMDRSGEKNLNPYDTHAIEAAMQLREGGAVEVDEIVAVTMGPDSAVRALHKAVSLGADRSLHLSDERSRARDVAATGYALAKALEKESPDLVLLGQQSDDGECYTIGRGRRRPPEDAVADAGDQARRRRRVPAARASGRVRLRHRQGDATGGDLGRRRDQRAALPVAEGDHGRQEEAARGRGLGDVGIDTSLVGAEGSRVQCGEFHDPPAKSAGQIIEDENTDETVEKIISWLEERKLI